jgi:TetR/AcrR family transcriptional repressor of nem operon
VPRPKAYDPDQALNKAMHLFWKDGYERTSIPRLESQLGINRFSIYSSFGSKRRLFLKSLQSYTDMLIDRLVEPLESGSSGMGDLQRFVSRFKDIFLDQYPGRGCLLCNMAVELGNQDPEVASHVEGYFDRIEKAVFDSFLRARELGELDDSRSVLRNRARLIRAGIQGVLIDLRLDGDGARARRTLGSVKSLLTD